MSQPAPVHVWTEPVDNAVVAVVAFSETVRRGRVYAASTFALVERQDARYWHQRERAGIERMQRYLADHHYGRLPCVGYVNDDDRIV